MKQSADSSSISMLEWAQLPTKGVRIPLKSDKPTYTKTLEGMGDGRYRVHVQLKRQKQP